MDQAGLNDIPITFLFIFPREAARFYYTLLQYYISISINKIW